MTVDTHHVATESSRPAWSQSLARYAQPNRPKAIWQLANTFIPYIALWVLMVYLVQHEYSYWIVLALSVPAAGLLVRIFIFFHDCGHGSFFASRTANRALGYIAGILTFTPYEQWRHSHALHHATAGNLDQRGVGDVWTMTVDEYLAAPRLTRFTYRLIRNPLVIFGVGAGLSFLFGQRWPQKGAQSGPQQRDLHRPGDSRHYRVGRPDDRIAYIPHDPDTRHIPGRRRRRLALLRPAPV